MGGTRKTGCAWLMTWMHPATNRYCVHEIHAFSAGAVGSSPTWPVRLTGFSGLPTGCDVCLGAVVCCVLPCGKAGSRFSFALAAERDVSWCSFHGWPRCSCEAREKGRGGNGVSGATNMQCEATSRWLCFQYRTLCEATDLCKADLTSKLTMLHNEGHEQHDSSCRLLVSISSASPGSISSRPLFSSFLLCCLVHVRRLSPPSRPPDGIGDRNDRPPALFTLTGAAPGSFVPFSNFRAVTQHDAMSSRLCVAQESTTWWYRNFQVFSHSSCD